jgi:hypothetical protein
MTSPHPDDLTLNDYAEGTLPKHRLADVDSHLRMCSDCRAVVDSLRLVRSSVGRLPLLAPPREAWTRIERTLRANAASRSSARWQWLAVAAALVLAVLGGMKLSEWRHQPASTANVPDGDLAAQSAAELLLAEQHYQKAIAGLERIANDEKGSLDPQVASTLEKNLAVVDQAISESRAALRTQPASEPAQASLLESFKAKIALLQDTVALINEMRKGSAAGDAGAVVGLKRKGS